MACIDLLGVAVGSGQTVADAVRAVGASGSGPVAAALDDAARAVDRGAPLVDHLDRLPARLGPSVIPLVGTLLAALASGGPAAPALHRLADAERRRIRRATEARVRRLPVLLTLPLVALVLPAFVVLTLVPVAVTVAGDLPAASPPPPSVSPRRSP